MSLDFKSIEEAEEFADEIVADVTEGLRQALKLASRRLSLKASQLEAKNAALEAAGRILRK